MCEPDGGVGSAAPAPPGPPRCSAPGPPPRGRLDDGPETPWPGRRGSILCGQTDPCLSAPTQWGDPGKRHGPGPHHQHRMVTSRRQQPLSATNPSSPHPPGHAPCLSVLSFLPAHTACVSVYPQHSPRLVHEKWRRAGSGGGGQGGPWEPCHPVSPSCRPGTSPTVTFW